jgi:hypothetical protein
VKAKLVVQVKLRSPNTDGSFSERVCFVDNAHVRIGSKVTLTGSEDRKRRWEVIWVSESIDAATIHLGWEAGGIRGMSR